MHLDCVSDVLEKSDVQGWRYLAYMWPIFMSIVLAIATIPMLVAALNLKWEFFLTGVVIIAGLGAFAFVFLGLQAVLGHFVFRGQLPRGITLRNGVLTVSQRDKIKEYSIAGCKWHEGSTLIDNIEMFTRLRRGIVLHAPEGRIVIGHRERSVERWRKYLTDAGVPQTRPLGCLAMIAWGLAGLLVGCVLGITMGYAMSAAGHAPIWRVVLGVLGAIDGAAGALLYGTSTADHAESARKRLNPVLLSLVFALLGAKVGLGAGWPEGLLCAIPNALIGLTVGWMCRRKIRLEELTQETNAALRQAL